MQIKIKDVYGTTFDAGLIIQRKGIKQNSVSVQCICLSNYYRRTGGSGGGGLVLVHPVINDHFKLIYGV